MILIFLLSGIFILLRYNLKIFNSKKEAVLTLGLLFIMGVICDSIAVWREYWVFQNVFQFRIFLLPIEEYLFFIVLPLWAIIIYKLIHNKFKK